MSGAAWPAATFEIASPIGPQKRNGYAWRGLGLYVMLEGSPKGRRKARWSLTHLGTGHLVCVIVGDVATAFPIASEIAEAGDWTFDGPKGYLNQFPDAAERLREIIARYPKNLSRSGGASDHDQARDIAMRRMA